MSISTEPSVDPAQDVAPRGRRRQVALAVVGAVALAGVVFAGRWWTHPTTFFDGGDSFRAAPHPVADAALSMSVAYPGDDRIAEPITVNNISARLSINSADSRVTFWVCHLTPGERQIIDSNGTRESFCQNSEALEPPMRLTIGPHGKGDYIFATVTPKQAGVTRLAAVEVSYQRSGKHLFQRGTQTIEMDQSLTAR